MIRASSSAHELYSYAQETDQVDIIRMIKELSWSDLSKQIIMSKRSKFLNIVQKYSSALRVDLKRMVVQIVGSLSELQPVL